MDNAMCELKNYRPNTDKRSNQRGLTLVEVVVGSALMILTFAALLLSFMRMTQSSVSARYSLDAMHAARSELETLRVISYSNIVSYTNIALTNTVLSDLGGQKHCSVITSTNDYKQITLTITWFNPGRPDSSSLSIDTLICNTN